MIEQLYGNKNSVVFKKYDMATPTIVTERVDGVNIGRITLPVTAFTTWEPNATALHLLNSLNGKSDVYEANRRSIRFSLNNNKTNERLAIAHDRAVSAYFTYNPNDETVIVEWGTINPNDEEAKLHSYLSRMINYRERVNNGMKLSSGHLAKTKSGLHLALFDNLSPSRAERIELNSPMGKTINTLYANNFVPITTDGFVHLPAF